MTGLSRQGFPYPTSYLQHGTRAFCAEKHDMSIRVTHGASAMLKDPPSKLRRSFMVHGSRFKNRARSASRTTPVVSTSSTPANTVSVRGTVTPATRCARQVQSTSTLPCHRPSLASTTCVRVSATVRKKVVLRQRHQQVRVPRSRWHNPPRLAWFRRVV